jgi:hypothetical protein
MCLKKISYLHASTSCSSALAALSPPRSHSRCFILATQRRRSDDAGRKTVCPLFGLHTPRGVGESQDRTRVEGPWLGVGGRRGGGGESVARLLAQDMGVPGAEGRSREDRLSREGAGLSPAGREEEGGLEGWVCGGWREGGRWVWVVPRLEPLALAVSTSSRRGAGLGLPPVALRPPVDERLLGEATEDGKSIAPLPMLPFRPRRGDGVPQSMNLLVLPCLPTAPKGRGVQPD